MSISRLLLVTAGIICVSTPVEAQQTGRNLDGTPTIVNPLCGKRPSGQEKGTTMKPTILVGADGKEYCQWSPESFVDLKAKKQIDAASRRPWYQDPCLGYSGNIQYCRAYGPNYNGGYQSGNFYVPPPPVTYSQPVCVPHQNPGSSFWTC